jgi:hypothetical protein
MLMNLSTRSRFGAALALAVAVDAVQIALLPLFAEGAISPLDDVLDSVAAVAMVVLTGWHWEFLPSFAAELVPGLDLVPFWTLAVANVYRKWKKTESAREAETPPVRIIDVTPQHPTGESEASVSGAPH